MRHLFRTPTKIQSGAAFMSDEIELAHPADMAPPGGHYSHAVAAQGLVFVSGQLPIAPDGTKLNEASFERQAQKELEKVSRALSAAGSAVSRLVQVRVYVTEIDSWPAFNALYAEWAGSARPARAVVPVPNLHYKIEIEAMALAGLS